MLAPSQCINRNVELLNNLLPGCSFELEHLGHNGNPIFRVTKYMGGRPPVLSGNCVLVRLEDETTPRAAVNLCHVEAKYGSARGMSVSKPTDLPSLVEKIVTTW